MKKTSKCNLCGKELSDRRGLNLHILGQHEGVRNYGPKRFKCSLCSFKTYMKSGLIKHTRTHTGERPFKCTVNDCTLTFKDNAILQNHIKYKHACERPLKCEYPRCPFTVKTPTTLTQHMKVHSDDRPFACPNVGCNFRAKFRMHIRRHVASVHSETKPFACSKCEFKSARPEASDYHMACHSTTREFQCSHPACKKYFKRPLDLRRHLSNRHEERCFPCDHSGCRKKFPNKILFGEHKRNVHSKKNLTCPDRECNFCTNRASHLTRHMTVHQRRNEKISCSEAGCDYKGKNSESMKLHMRSHRSIYECPQFGCSQYISTKEKPDGRVKLHKPSARPIHCPLCFKHFRTLSSLQEHCVTLKKEKQFKCGYCDYATAHHLQIKNLISLVHSSVQFPFIAHVQGLRECLRCKVKLPSSQFLIHSITHAVPLVMIDRIETRWS